MSEERQRTFERAAAGGWDLLVVGGGITGAGILHEAARRGAKALLVDQGDFASGTSSRSSKLVHGGLRYLAEGDVRLTWQAVRERERLLAELPGLVEPIGFLLASYEGDRLGRRLVRLGLRLYDLLGSGVKHRALSAEELAMLAPRLSLDGSTGGFWYRDAQTDDARLVLRVLFDAVALGASALNYARVEELVMRGGAAGGAVLRDGESGRALRVEARAVVNATGAWADGLRACVDGMPAIRPLRGSHLLFPAWRFPVAQAVTFRHPQTRRPLFACPWEGLTLLGTTDLDHERPLGEAPVIAAAEAASMLEAARAAFPQLTLRASDAVSSFSGVRPVIGTGQRDPSKESRDHVIWSERGLWTVTGGKLTTFRAIARQAVDALGLGPSPPEPPAGAAAQVEPRRLAGRYGAAARALVGGAREGELEPVPGTATLWAELRHAARAEAVVHLDDLLLRRVRLGLLLPEGGREHLPRVRGVCQGELGWSDERWATEEQRYRALWHAQHRPPE